MRFSLQNGAIFAFCLSFSSHATATPTVRFAQTSISVSQTAGVVEIPIIISGSLDYDSFTGQTPTAATFGCETLAGSASSGQNYDGFGDEFISHLDNYNGVSRSDVISIPIYFLKNPTATFFNVSLYPAFEDIYRTDGATTAEIGTPTSIRVTILGYVAPKITISTLSATAGTPFSIRGQTLNLSNSEIQKVSVKIGGVNLITYGKTSWYTKLKTITRKGTYPAEATALLTTGETLYFKRYITIR